MNCFGVVKISKVSVNIHIQYRNYTVSCIDLNKNKIIIHIKIFSSEKSLLEKANRILIENNRISFNGVMNSNGFIDAHIENVSQSYLEKTSVKIKGKERVVIYNCSDNMFDINIQTPNYSTDNTTFQLYAKAGTSDSYKRINEILSDSKHSIDYEGVMLNNHIYLTKID